MSPMSKKTKSGKKKHQFKYAQPAEPVAAAASVEKAASEKLVGAKAPATNVMPEPITLPGRDLSYLPNDLRRIGVLAVGLIALEFLLWYLFNHTGLGPAVYKLVTV